MRIAVKFTMALMSAIAMVLVMQAVAQYHRVTALHERETRDDLAILARALGNAAGQIWTTSGEQSARAYVRAADQRRARTRITMRAGAPPSAAATLRDGDQLVAYVPLTIDHSIQAHVELRRSLDRAVDYRQSVIWTQIGTTAIVVAIAALLSLLLGIWLIGRPVRTLIEQTRRVARGELDTSIELPLRDELGNLASELNTMTSQLRAARGQLQTQRRARAALQEQLRHADRLSTVGRVASAIAHELGTPLNVVAGRAAMIASEASDDAIVKNARIIAEQTERITAIIRELLDFSRRRGVKREDTRLADVIEQATTLLEPICEDHGVEVAADDMHDLRADIDVNKTLQVLTNLMMNAVQAMPDGGTLRIGAREEHVDDPRNDHAEPGDYIAITVSDDGVGIEGDDLDNIFRPFFTTKRAGRGTGLGLYVCHGIVREQSGWFDVSSEPGRGTTFTVYLPQRDPGSSDA